MKPIKQITLVATLVLLMGCATTFRPWNLSEISEGMDRAQVVQILGEPDSTEQKEGEELLYYSYREDRSPSFQNDTIQAYEANRDIEKQQIKKSLEEYKYVVTLVDGKVANYKEIQD